MPLPIRIPNFTLWSSRSKNSLHYSKSNKRTKSISQVPDLQMRTTNQDKIRQDFDHVAEEMDTPSCTAELKLTMMRLLDTRFKTTRSTAQFSLMTTIKEEDQFLGLITLKISISNRDTEIRIIRHPINNLASTQIETETQIQMNSITNADQATPGTVDQITVSKLSANLALDQRTQTLNKIKNSPQSNNIPTPNSVQFFGDQGQDVVNIRFLPFKLLKSPRTDEKSNFKSHFHMNAFCFPTGDNQKDSGLANDLLLDSGATCSVIKYRTFLEINQLRQPITIIISKQKTKTYTGEVVPRIGHTSLSFCFDSDRGHQLELRIWITETQTSNLIGIEFCREYISKLHFEKPAKELKNTANVICYGIMCSTKPYPFVPKIQT